MDTVLTDPPPVTDDLTTPVPRPRQRQRWVAYGLLATVLFATAYLTHRARLLGHWWGDDWALYIRQANGLLDLDPGKVAAQNSFTVTQSAGAPFSPPIYPWGYPAVLALAIPFVGDGVDNLAIIGVIATVLLGAFWYALARPRLGDYGAIVGMVAVCFTPQILSWTDLIQSELVFMVAVFGFLFALDKMVRRGTLLAESTRLVSLFGLGIAAGFAFEIRREGLATVAAIGAAQLVVLADRFGELRAQPAVRPAIGARFVAPHLGFLTFAAAIKIFFPAVLVPRYEGAGISNVWRLWHKHVDHFADLIGLKNAYKPEPSVLGSVVLGRSLLWLWIGVLLIALVLAVTRWRRTEAHLAAYVVVAFVIGCSARAALARYFASVVPIASLLVLTAAVAAARFFIARLAASSTPRNRSRWVAVAIPQLVVLMIAAPMAVANFRTARERAHNATIAREAGLVQWGAQHPDAQAMFTWVNEHTSATDIVASFKARSMVLETGRPTIQADDYRPLNPAVDVAVIVQETTSRRLDDLLDDGWTIVWYNDRLVVLAPADSALAAEFGRPRSGS